MRNYISIILVLFIVFLSTCEEDVLLFNVNCDECYYPEPDTADLIVHVTLNSEIKEVPLVFYQGKADKKVVEYIDTARTSLHYLAVKTEKFYSVEAKYELTDKTVIVVDGTKIKNRKVTDECSETCYVHKNQDLYVELKK